MTFYSLEMTSANGQRLAEFLITEDRVIAIPSFSLMRQYEQDPSDPIGQAKPGMRWLKAGFLGYLLLIAAHHKDDPRLAFQLRTVAPTREYVDILLNRSMTAGELAKILDMPLDEVRRALREHLTFPDA